MTMQLTRPMPLTAGAGTLTAAQAGARAAALLRSIWLAMNRAGAARAAAEMRRLASNYGHTNPILARDLLAAADRVSRG